MEKIKNVVAIGERLYAKPIENEDAKTLMSLYIHDNCDDFDSIKYAFNKDGKINERKLYDTIRERIDGYKKIKLSSKQKFSRVLIYKKETNEAVGMVGFDLMEVENFLNPISPQCQEYDTSKKAIVLIYKIHPHHCNKGYATEACRMMLKWFFEKFTHKQILANIYMNNYPSLRVAEKLGFKKIYEYQCNTRGAYNAYCCGLKEGDLI